MTEKMSLYDLIEDPWNFLDLVEEPFGDNAAHSDQNCFGYSTSNYEYDDINIIHPIGEQPPDIILQDAPTSTTDVQVEQQQQYEQQQLLQQHSSTTDVQVEQQQQYEQQPLVIPLEQQYEQQEMLQQPSSTTDLQVDQQQYEQHQQLPLHNGHQRILLHQDHLEPTPQPSTISNNCQPTTVQCQNQGSNNVVLYTIPQSTFVQQPQGTLHVAQKGGSGVIDVPSFKDMKGEYDFTVSVEEKERTTKSPMWLMSKITNKLYTNINKAVPFEVRMNKNAQRRQFYVRSTVVFSSVQFRLSNVMRCPNHASPSDATNHEFPYPEHVVRADHPDAKYLTSPCGRLSVRVPLDATDGLCYAPILLRFMCLGSCVGGINRRPIAIILTLEDREGVACGRKVIDVRVCACPTRDIKTDEAAFANKGPKRKSSVLGHQDKTTTVVSKKPKNVEIKSERNEDDCLYNIPVRGKKLYDFLTKMKAVYYQTHPEYAAKYPDDLISMQTDEYIKEDLKGGNLRIDVGESETVNWDSGGDSPQRIVISHDAQSGTLVAKNSSPLSKLTPNITISPQPVQLRLWSDMCIEDMSFPQEDNTPEFTPSSSAQRNCMIINSSKVNYHPNSNNTSDLVTVSNQVTEKVNHIPKHIPVRQVPYKPGSTSVKTKVMPLLKPVNILNRGSKSGRSSKKKIDSSSYRPLDSIESNQNGAYGSPSSPPLSPEMRAAYVLAEGFKNNNIITQ